MKLPAQQNSVYNLRVSKYIKDRFQELAEQNGTSASKLLRQYMRKYIREQEALGNYDRTDT